MLYKEDKQVLFRICRWLIAIVILLGAGTLLVYTKGLRAAQKRPGEAIVSPTEDVAASRLITMWQRSIDTLSDFLTGEASSLKQAFYNAEGPFSFLHSGDCWCPNRLLRPWADEYAIP